MKDPTKRFGEIIGWIDDAGNVTKNDVTGVLPVLDGKVLDHNVTAAFSRDAGIDHVDGRLVITV